MPSLSFFLSRLRSASFLTFIILLLTLLPAALLAQKPPAQKAPSVAGPRATTIRDAQLYISADVNSSKVDMVTPGHELVIIEQSGDWFRVFGNTDIEENPGEVEVFGTDVRATPASGWVLKKGIIGQDTPQGDAILFGAAASAENEASNPHGRKTAASDARLLYRRVAEYFPSSQLAPEASWRSADIRWQLQKIDSQRRPSAHEKENYLREQMDEDEMHKLEKKYPHSKWADLAAWNIIDNKLCGDWQGSTKCPEKEAGIYEKYAAEHPDSPKTPEALYQAAWRLASAADIHSSNGDSKKATEDRDHGRQMAEQVHTRFPLTDWGARGASLVYRIDQSIPIYGSDRD